MTRKILAFCCLLVCGRLALAEQGNPVTKVVELIQELKAKIEEDGRSEQKVYNKFACWCETTTTRKSEAIEKAKDDIGTLGANVMEMKGKAASMASQIAALTKDIRKNEEAQQRATAIREKENTDYAQEKAEMAQAVGALDKAITTLQPVNVAASASLLKLSSSANGGGKKHTGAAQSSATMELLKVVSGVKGAVNALPTDFSLPPEQANLLDKFMKDPVSYLAQKVEIESTANEAYDPQATTIQSILKEMHNSFSANLKTQAESEAEAQSGYADLMATKAKELTTMKAVLMSREAIKGDSEAQWADASQELQDTEAQMNADSDFFDRTKKACEEKAEEWEERSRLRTAELEGITKALDVLTADDARALFGKSIKPGMETFLQLGSDSESPREAKAVFALKNARSKRLALLAEELSTGHNFAKIVAKVEKMIKTLEEEEQTDIDQRDWCKETIFKEETEESRYGYLIEKTEAKIGKLNQVKDDLENAIAETDAEILATNEEVSEMTATRKEDKGAFEQAKADDEAAANLLGVAIGHLSKFYEDEGMELGGMQQDADTIAAQGGALLQEPTFEVSDEQALSGMKDADFSAGDKSKGESKGIIMILTMLKEDTEDEIKNGVKNEEASQKLYDEQKAAAEKLIGELQEKKTNLKSDVAETNTKIENEETTQGDAQEDKDETRQYLNEIAPNCDFMLKNFEIRRNARKAEQEGLHEAVAMMSGAGGTPGTGLLQGAEPKQQQGFDDDVFPRQTFSGLAFLQKNVKKHHA